MTKRKVGIISLGCDKNRIDSEIILGRLKGEYELTANPKEAEIIIVNTCGFIETSKQESINTILEMANFKKKYNCKVLIATGCLTQRYNTELQELIPEIDILLGVNDYDKIIKCIDDFYDNKQKILLCSSFGEINEGDRIITTSGKYAYLKISEGCNNNCTYCAIPKIRGAYRSRAMESIIDEATVLVEQGIEEIILVAQDTTLYGIDLYGEKRLPTLLDELSNLDKLKWIRLLYCYPEEIDDKLISTIASNPKVCKYIDIPIQHISNNILKAMGRKGTKENIIKVINKLRTEVNKISLRTTFIVGFPGETEEDFNELLEFVKSESFDNVGVFEYSPEDNTPAARMKNQIEDKLKAERKKTLMLTQQKISFDKNKLKVNNLYSVLIEDFDGEFYIGRNEHMAPDIDGMIYVKSGEKLNIGQFISVKVTDSLEYDLIGDVFYESC